MTTPLDGIETLSDLQRAGLALKKLRARLDALQHAPIAVIGMSCRFPGGANSPAAYWRNLYDGVDAVSEVPPERWDVDAYYDPDPATAGKINTRWGGFLDTVDQFDAQFFGIFPREAASQDPQQRLLLEVSWEALEAAGQTRERLAGRSAGFFLGITSNDYAQLIMQANDPSLFDAYFVSGNPLNTAAGRIAYTLGLQGPCLAVDTACSSSLVAVHLACRSLRAEECELALAAGVNLVLCPESTIGLSHARLLSGAGRCRTFDAAADGYVRGEGCGVVVLKQLSRAQKDSDPILAVLRGSAVNHDGTGSGFMAPNGLAHQEVIRLALADARVEGSEISYVEAHGTATPLGDPIEVRALAKVLGKGRSAENPLIMGTVKTNIGHTEAASGVASLIKVILALQHKCIPPHLHLQIPNPNIPWDELPMQVPAQPIPWPAAKGPRLAGINSFGASGTNAHVVVEEAPPVGPCDPGRTWHLLLLSAKTPTALVRQGRQLAAYLQEEQSSSLADVAYTLQVGRQAFQHRRMLLCRTKADALEALSGDAGDQVSTRVFPAGDRPLAFLFAASTAARQDMARGLYQSEWRFREAVDHCCELLPSPLAERLRNRLYPTAENGAPAGWLLEPGVLAATASFIVGYSLAQLCLAWGVRPQAMLGEGDGELVAACLAGVFPLADGLRLAAADAEERRSVLRQATLQPPQIPFISGLNGKWISKAQATDPEYWQALSSASDRFDDGLALLGSTSGRLLLTVGPGEGLYKRVAAQPAFSSLSEPAILALLPAAGSQEPDEAAVLQGLGRLWLAGTAVSWAKLYEGERRACLPLPTYPFERQRHWLATPGPRRAQAAARADTVAAPRHRRPDLSTSFQTPEGPLETQMVELWEDLFGIAGIGVDDNFLELGGHSVLGVQMISRLRQSFGVELPLRAIFDAPTAAKLARRVAKELAAKGAAADGQPVIGRRPAAATAPLSFSQRRLWFLDRLDAGSYAYNLPMALRLVGPLQVAALKRSLTEIVRRHEILRTCFPIVDESPVQRIVDVLDPPLTLVDLRNLPEPDRAAEEKRLVDEELKRPFELETGPLLRALLVQLTEQEHLVLVVMHHIISDGWSLGVFLQEAATLYNAYVQDMLPELPELSVQFADFAIWQRQYLESQRGDDQIRYWRNQLAGAPSYLNLPTDRNRPPLQTFDGHTEYFQLPAELSQGVRMLGQRTGVSPFMIFQAALALLLSRYSGQQDLIIGSPVANRNFRELEPLIGFLLNNLVLRFDLSGDPTFQEFLQRVRHLTLEATAHQDVPFEQLVEVLQPERNLSYSPLFQVMLDYQQDVMTDLALHGLTVTKVPLDTPFSRFDLTLYIKDSGASFSGALEYNTALFERGTMLRLAGHLEELLRQVVADPDQRLSAVSFVSAAERHQLLVEWNRTRVSFPSTSCFHRLFEEQVERRPDAPAVACGADRLTYRQLNERANRLAHHLRSLGAGPEARVGICLERSLEMLVGLLGVLKAGAAYVPLDPAYPKERITYMLEDAAVRLLVTQSEVLAGWAPPGITPVCLERDHEAIDRQSSQNPVLALDAANLAYTIYTSGSTGKPKGVEISHRALVNFLNAMRLRPGLSEQDVVLAVTTIAFDIAALELYLPLLVGAQIVLMDRTTAIDGGHLLTELQRSGATVMQATPATWRLLLAASWQGTPGLKILCGGEAMPRDLARQLMGRGGAVWNLYGPTETTIWSTVGKVAADEEVGRSEAPQPIGRPIDNTRIYILDEQLRPVPVGIPGALFIGGEGLARGYRRQPALTAEKFIPDPFSDHPGARMYDTGDRARYAVDGSIEFLGRLDHQVKIRGFRIEVGEIEAVLAKHPAIRENVVVARRGPDGIDRLVAYLILDPTKQPTVSELRAFVQTQLPDYMVPAVFEQLAAFPLTPNSKIDRKALPEPKGLRPELAADFRLPRTEVEKKIAEIWQEVLQVDRVGIQDNFFDLGGHSLLMVTVHRQLQAALGESLSLVELFQYPTIQELAQRLTASPDRMEAASAGQDRARAREAGQSLRAQRQQLRRRHRDPLSTVDEQQ